MARERPIASYGEYHHHITIIVGYNSMMSSTSPDENTTQLYPTKSKNSVTYDQFMSDNTLRACNIFAAFLHSLQEHSTVEWWFDIYRLGDSDNWNKSSLSYLCYMKQNFLTIFLNIAGLVRIGGRHDVEIVKNSWTAFFIRYNLTDCCEVSKVKLKIVDNKQSTHWFLKIGDCKHEPKSQFKEKNSNTRVFCAPFTRRQAFFKKFTDQANVILASLMNSFYFERSYIKQLRETIFPCDNNDDINNTDEKNTDKKKSATINENENDEISFEPAFDAGESDNNIEINSEKYPILSKLGNSLSQFELGGLLRDIVSIHRDQSKPMNFKYQNGRDGLLLPIPSSSSYYHFQKNNKRRNWIEPLLQHVSGNEESEGAEFMANWLFTHHEDVSLLVAKQRGLPILQQMDEHTAAAMWKESKTSIYSQRIILKFLRDTFGRRIVIPEKKIQALGSDFVRARYGSISYKKKEKGKKNENVKEEIINFWTRSLQELILSKTKALLEVQVNSSSKNEAKLSPYETGSVNRETGWELIFGADHGRGLWKAVIKLYYKDYNFRRDAHLKSMLETTTRQSKEGGYIELQVAHVDCKNDNYEILSKTVSEEINNDLVLLSNSQLIGVVGNKNNIDVKLISKYASNIRITKKENMFYLSYEILSNKDGELSVSMEEKLELPFHSSTTMPHVELTVPAFAIFVTSDLCFYADMLGKPNSSGHWCHLCGKSWKNWNQENTTGKKATLKTLCEHLSTFQNNPSKGAVCGVSKPMLLSHIKPFYYVIPLLHLMIGLVNKVWDHFCEWIDKEIENLDEEEIDVRNILHVLEILVEDSVERLKETESENNFQIKALKVDRIELRKEIKKIRTGTNDRLEKEALVEELSSMILHFEGEISNAKILVKKNKDELAKVRKK